VHAGKELDPSASRPTSTPIYNASSFVAPSAAEIDGILSGEQPGYAYTRDGNPTVAAFERAVADLEGTEGAAAFGSGMAAIHGALIAGGVKYGGRVVAARDCYGRTRGLLLLLERDFGVAVELVDCTDLDAVQRALEEPTDLLLAETISNPLVKVVDVPQLASLAHAAGAKLMIDATFTSPVLAQVAGAGADLIVHSATKYLGGHGDVTGGVACASGDLLRRLREVATTVGGVLGPNEAWLCLRGLKTLPLRMERQCANAALLAHHLSRHARVERVHFPGLPEHPQHKLAQQAFGGRFGAIVSIEIRGAGRPEILRFMDALELIQPAPTLGDVATLVSYSAQSSHRSLPREERLALGITDALVRLSIGIEDVNDLIADLDQALSRG
jgi:cystathionine gamma-synthase/methionine-gamma-lyase